MRTLRRGNYYMKEFVSHIMGGFFYRKYFSLLKSNTLTSGAASVSKISFKLPLSSKAVVQSIVSLTSSLRGALVKCFTTL